MALSKEYIKNKNWFFYNVHGCQNKNCETSDPECYWVANPHHIIFESGIPEHPQWDCMANLIQLCDKCNNKFHSSKMRAELIKERRLYKLFGIKGENESNYNNN